MAAACVVCQVPATLYCQNDRAFLCRGCDVKIHSQNQVASRHTRVSVCGLCCKAACTVFCTNDDVHLCAACDSEIHSNNPLAASHEVVPAAALPACEAPSWTASASAAAPCESVAQSGGDLLAGCSGVLMDTDFSSSLLGEGCPADLASKGAPSPSGSEAVVPVMSLPMDEDFCAGLAVPAFKDLKDFDDFKVLGEGDGAWLDMGFDFSDILSDDAGRVPTFSGAGDDEVDDVATVPTFSAPTVPVMEVGSAPAPAPVNMRKRSAPSAAEERAAKAAVAAASAATPATLPSPSSFSAQQQQHQQFVAAYPGYAAPYAAAAAALAMSGATLTREQRVARYREKRKNRKFEKTIRYASRKAYAEIRPRIKGRFARKEEIEAWKALHGGEDAVVPEILDE